MNNAYIYKAKEINWRTSAKDEEKQYVIMIMIHYLNGIKNVKH